MVLSPLVVDISMCTCFSSSLSDNSNSNYNPAAIEISRKAWLYTNYTKLNWSELNFQWRIVAIPAHQQMASELVMIFPIRRLSYSRVMRAIVLRETMCAHASWVDNGQAHNPPAGVSHFILLVSSFTSRSAYCVTITWVIAGLTAAIQKWATTDPYSSLQLYVIIA